MTDSLGRSPIKAAGLWLGGLDPGGNLKMAVQMYNVDGKQDFVPGFVSEPEGDWNQIWKTTGYDILSHLYDYYDDQIINDTLPSIFGWPAYGNKFFKDIHGFELPDEPNLLADFRDMNHNDIYDPDLGEHPIIRTRGCEYNFMGEIPDEMLWYAFHDKTIHTQSDTSLPILMNVSNTIFNYSCTNNPTLNNSIFSKYKLVNAAKEDIDSCFFGLFVDFELGCPEDDYFGVIPESNIIYAYNSDALDEKCGDYEGFAEYPPTVAVKMIRGPLNEYREELDIFSVMPLFETPPEVSMGMPVKDQEFYNYLTGSWLFGTPLTYGENGFDPNSTSYHKHIYPGHPANEEEWSEVSAGNSPGHRKAVASSGPFLLQPETQNEIIVSFTFLENGRYDLRQHLIDLYEGLDFSMSFFDACSGVLSPHCNPVNPLPDPPKHPLEEIEAPFVFIPNPATNEVRIRFLDLDFATSIEIYDAMCRLVLRTERGQPSYSSFDVSNWPQGVYYAIARKGPELYFQQLVVARK